MKYHWIGFHPEGKGNNTEIEIPERVKPLDSNVLVDLEDNDDDFQPQIIHSVRSDSVITNLTKQQIIDNCSQLLQRKINDKTLLDLAIGECVISNYRDSIREESSDITEIGMTMTKQEQIVKSNKLKACQKAISSEKTKNEIEKQLLLGICLSK